MISHLYHMKVITVTSTHHWSQNRKYVITIGYEGHKTIHCYENDRRKKFHSHAEFLLSLFEFFGCIEEIHIEGGNYPEVYNAVYDHRIPPYYVFINKGYTHLHEPVEFITLKSFFEFMSKFGLKPHDSEIKWYINTRGIDYDFGSRPYYGYPDGLLCHLIDIGVFEDHHFIEIYFER